MRPFVIATSLQAILLSAGTVLSLAGELLPVPDRLIVLTFDDGNKTDIEFVAPLLKQHDFGATFFVSDCDWFRNDKKTYMTWEEVRKLHDMGFEVGNHTRSHPNLANLPAEAVAAEVEAIEQLHRAHGLPHPTSFCYPGYNLNRTVVEVVSRKGYRFARRGVAPEYPYSDRGDRGPAYDPAEDHPLLVPTTGASGPNYAWDDFLWTVNQARDGKIAVLTFHGVPDVKHPWVNTDRVVFQRYMQHLKDNNFTVIALRDLARYADPTKGPSDPFAPLERRVGLRPAELKCESVVDPQGVDTPAPRFSWIFESLGRGQAQSAFHILVAGSLAQLATGIGDKWDSGRVGSDESVHISYGGKPLASGEVCYWKVRVWDKQGRPSSWSKPATFGMGLLQKSDWQGAWIAMGDLTDAVGGKTKTAGGAKTSPAPRFRKEFEIDARIRRARVYVSGLGYYELHINGKRVGDRVLDPAPSNYHNDQPYEMPSRVSYVTYDVTDYLKAGRNALGIQLGNGWYSAVTKASGRQPYGDRPKLLLQMNVELADDRRLSMVTDRTWKTAGGPVLDNEFCGGESYDARLETPGWTSSGWDDSSWQPVLLPDPPSGVLVSQVIPAAKVVKTFKPVKILKPAEGVYVYDFGQNMSGWARLRVRGPSGAKVQLRYSPQVYGDGRLDTRPNKGAKQTDSYTLKGGGLEEWEPRFTLHGFRYVEVTGFPGEPSTENLEARFVRSNLDLAGHFACSNPLINQIHHNALWTFLSSLQGIPQDAAERDERVAWLGDTGFVWEDYIYNIDMAAFTAKWLWDIRDTQRPTGELAVTAPHHSRNGQKGPAYSPYPCWISTYPLLAWYAYQYYADTRVLEEHYDGFKKMVAYKAQHAPGHIFTHGLGDHMEPQTGGVSSFRPKNTSPLLTSTAYYYYDVWLLSRMAEVLGRDEDARRYGKLAVEIKEAFHRKFFDETAGYYGTGTQTANALALYFDMVPESRHQSVVERLAHDIAVNHKGHLSTGIIGINALEQTLAKHGLVELMYGIATKTTPPSWGYQVRNGATTVWETWQGEPSHSMNMKMLGSSEVFFFRDLAGIAPAAPGFRRITIQPHVVGDLKWVKAWHNTIRGRVAIHWRRDEGALVMEVTIPPNTTATVNLPTLGLKNVAVAEGGKTVWKDGASVAGAIGIRGASQSADCVAFDVGSGSYSFRLTGIKR